MEDNDSRYIYLPLHLIDVIEGNLAGIINYGMVRFAKTFSFKNIDVYRQIVYLYYRGELLDDLITEITDLINDGLFTDYSETGGFDDDGSFDPDDNIEELRLSWSENATVFDKCVLVYQIGLAAEAFSVIIEPEGLIKSWNWWNEKAMLFEQLYGKDALVSISMDMALDYRDNDKDAYEIELLKAFLAIKSLQGKSKLCETNKAAIVMRMTGAKNSQVFKEKKRTNSRLVKKYSNRYHIDKLLNDLRLKGFIQSKLPNNRSLFISTSLNENALAKAAFELIKKKQQKTQKATIKKQENEAKDLLNQLLQHA